MNITMPSWAKHRKHFSLKNNQKNKHYLKKKQTVSIGSAFLQIWIYVLTKLFLQWMNLTAYAGTIAVGPQIYRAPVMLLQLKTTVYIFAFLLMIKE